MPNLNPIDAQLLEIVSSATPAAIADVIAIMRSIDGLLPGSDGLKWFNKLYLMVTQQIDAQPPPNGWEDAAWLTRLDVVFAGFYFAAIAHALRQNLMSPVRGRLCLRPGTEPVSTGYSLPWRG